MQVKPPQIVGICLLFLAIFALFGYLTGHELNRRNSPLVPAGLAIAGIYSLFFAGKKLGKEKEGRVEGRIRAKKENQEAIKHLGKYINNISLTGFKTIDASLPPRRRRARRRKQ